MKNRNEAASITILGHRKNADSGKMRTKAVAMNGDCQNVFQARMLRIAS